MNIVKLCVSFMVCACNPNQDNDFRYGVKFNVIRDSLGIVSLDSCGKVFQINDSTFKWQHSKQCGYSKSYHSNKMIILKNDSVYSEKDVFRFDGNDADKTLIITYLYTEKHQTFTYLEFNLKNSVIKQIELNKEQSDSVLINWEIKK